MKLRYRIILSAIAALTLCTTVSLLWIRHEIHKGGEKWTAAARAAHPEAKDELMAMLAFLQSEEHSLEDRNHMVWAIGQFRRAEALPILGKYYTGEECNHSEQLCQYELEKAMRLCHR